MARWRKLVGWTAISLGALLLLAIFAGALLLKSAAFHRYVLAKIVQSASESTGARVELQNFDFRVKTLTADIYGLTIHGKESADDKPLLTIDDVCRLFQISRPTIYTLIDQGLPAMKLGKAVRFSPTSLQRWLARREEIA